MSEQELTAAPQVSQEISSERPPENAPAPAGQTPESTPADWEAALAAARAEERARCEAEQNERLAEAVAAERARYEALTREQALSKALGQDGLSPAFAPLLLGGDAEEDGKRLSQFRTLFRAELSRAVSERMRGTEVPRAPEPPKGYDRAALRAMSAREINEQWEEISAAMGQR